jgi:hypothetical protein
MIGCRQFRALSAREVPIVASKLAGHSDLLRTAWTAFAGLAHS